MIELIVGVDINLRKKKREEVLTQFGSEPIVLDDVSSSLSELEAYVYPSLFSTSAPVIHASYLIASSPDSLTKEFTKKLLSSPTIFILEERDLASTLLKLAEKEGVVIHKTKETKKTAPPSNIFGVTNAITANNKKERWLAYNKAKEEHSAEALIGILYWKLRQLIEKSGAQDTEFKKLYRDLILAHKNAWQKGFPLELAIEKVILEQ